MVGMERVLENNDSGDSDEEARAIAEKEFLMSSMDRFIIKEDD